MEGMPGSKGKEAMQNSANFKAKLFISLIVSRWYPENPAI